MSANFQDRDLVLPGDVLFEGRIRTGENTYRNQEQVYATRLGLVNYSPDNVSVTALSTGYTPLVGDVIIGEVVDMDLGAFIDEFRGNADTRGVARVDEDQAVDVAE